MGRGEELDVPRSGIPGWMREAMVCAPYAWCARPKHFTRVNASQGSCTTILLLVLSLDTLPVASTKTDSGQGEQPWLA